MKLKKKEAMERWRNLAENQPILPHMKPLPYDARGSRYGSAGIRIDGSPEFCDAVLSRLKDILAAENSATRINLSWNEVSDDDNLGKRFNNKEDDASCVYIRLQSRGNGKRTSGAKSAAALSRSLKRKVAAGATAPLEL